MDVIQRAFPSLQSQGQPVQLVPSLPRFPPCLQAAADRVGGTLDPEVCIRRDGRAWHADRAPNADYHCTAQREQKGWG